LPAGLDHEVDPKADFPAAFSLRNRHGNRDAHGHCDLPVQGERGFRSKPGEPNSPGGDAGSALSLPSALTFKPYTFSSDAACFHRPIVGRERGAKAAIKTRAAQLDNEN
jgi:hypothetical protein